MTTLSCTRVSDFGVSAQVTAGTVRRMADKPAAEPSTGSDRPLWKLSRDEQRQLAITVVGGLAAILLGAGVLGGALAMSRWLQRPRQHLLLPLLAPAVPWMVVLGIFTALGILGALGYVLLLRRKPRFTRRRRIIWRFTTVVWFVIWIFLVLAWIGVAAGIR